MGRFINADAYISTGQGIIGNNMFAYCSNNPICRSDSNGEHWYYLWLDDLFEAVDEMMACTSNIVYGRAAFERSFYDYKGANDLWNSRPFQDVATSPEMQIFTETIYDTDVVADISVSYSIGIVDRVNIKEDYAGFSMTLAWEQYMALITVGMNSMHIALH